MRRALLRASAAAGVERQQGRKSRMYSGGVETKGVDEIGSVLLLEMLVALRI